MNGLILMSNLFINRLIILVILLMTVINCPTLVRSFRMDKTILQSSSFSLHNTRIGKFHNNKKQFLKYTNVIMITNNPNEIPSSSLSAQYDDDDEDEPMIIIRGSENDDLDDTVWENIETGKPSDLQIMKELMGINIFTYILGGLIVLFLSLNFFLGPGWLGQAIGLSGTGSIQEISPSLPDTIDLSNPEFRL